MADDRSASVGTWFEFVRRARLNHEVKRSALIVGSYADTDGTGIYCGVARLAVDTGAGYSTARRHLALLRSVGLIELVARGGRTGPGRAWKSDLYRLTLPPDLLDRLEQHGIHLPDPSEYKAMVDRIREANQAGQRERRTRGLRSPMRAQTGSLSALAQVSAGATDRSAPALAQVSAGAPISAHLRSDQRSPMGERPPLMSHLGSEVLTSHDEKADLRTDIAVPRANGHQDQISSEVLVIATPSAGGCGRCTSGYRLVEDRIERCECTPDAATAPLGDLVDQELPLPWPS